MTAPLALQDRVQAPLVRLAGCGPAMVGPIQVFADSSFEYAEQGDGRDAMLYPVELDSVEVIDTVA